MPRHPVPGRKVSSGFAWWEQFRKTWNLGPHSGVDFPCPEGTVVYAPMAGKAVGGGSTGGPHGFFVRLDSQIGSAYFRHWLIHLSSYFMPNIALGTWREVMEGQPVGRSGNTGWYTTGPHLHWTVESWSGTRFVRIDPAALVNLWLPDGTWYTNVVRKLDQDQPGIASDVPTGVGGP